MPRRAAAAEVIAAVGLLAATHPQRTVWVGVDGFGGAGKTTLAAAIATAVSRAVVVHVDDFSAPAFAEWDWARFRQQVAEPLLAARPARYQVWDWDADVGGGWVDVAPGPVLVVEGVSSTRAEVAVPWDLTVWVDAPHDVRLLRARDRDGEAMLPVWLERWMPSEQAYAERERPQQRVDLVVSGVD